MSWINTLYMTYENLRSADDFEAKNLDPQTMLYPVGHTNQIANIEVVINERLECIHAEALEKKNGVTIIPCTEDSASRGGQRPPPHPLFDKLQYVAGDYAEFGTKGGEFHRDYMLGLKRWCESDYSSPKLKILYAYLEKGTLIRDLVEKKVLFLGEDGRIMEKWTGDREDTPLIFKATVGAVSDSFVRFAVSGAGGESRLWEDGETRALYERYSLDREGGRGVCYVTGKEALLARFHPYKIRNPADKAKLISGNDGSGFTFRGRFSDAGQAVQVSYEVSQKAHNALRHLIAKQGQRFGSRVYVAWNPEGKIVPQPLDDTLGTGEDSWLYTGEDFAERFNKLISGYFSHLEDSDAVCIIGVDAATTGRLSIVFYRETTANELIANIRRWHMDCKWLHEYAFDADENPVSFTGAPSPRDIATMAYGTNRDGHMKIDDKLLAASVSRILPCISDGAPLPGDMADALFKHFCEPLKYKRRYQRRKVTSICCSLVRKQRLEKSNGKEEWNMAVDENNRDISYLCGRWLAVADVAERSTYEKDETGRETNAVRFFSQFAAHPNRAMMLIRNRLHPYLRKIGSMNMGLRVYYEKQLSDISSLIDPEEFANAKRLGSLMALGFDSQRKALYTKKPGKDGQGGPETGDKNN